MISFLKGIIEYKDTGSITINVNGVGYLVFVSHIEKYGSPGEHQAIFTYLYLREDRVVLYGFLNKEERDFFKLLIDAPGIGPKVAMNILADMGPERFKLAVLKEDLQLISSISGIGNKLAKKIIIELKEKINQFKLKEENHLIETTQYHFVNDGIEALKALGYQEKEAKQRITNALKKVKNKEMITIEELIKHALIKDSG